MKKTQCTCLSDFLKMISISQEDQIAFCEEIRPKNETDSIGIQRFFEDTTHSKYKIKDSIIWDSIRLHTRALYAHMLHQIHSDSSSHTHRYFYRGQADVDYRDRLAPGIYRSSEQHCENYYFNEMQVRCPGTLAGLKTINKLTYMQHYGCPTRLLDITANPLVALYFACCECNTFNDAKDGVVFIFGVKEDDVLYEQSDRVQMLSKLAEFKKEDQAQLLMQSYINLMKGSFNNPSGRKYADRTVERFYHAIKRDNGAFEREIIPFDLLRPLFVQTNKDNPRILKQDGAFIICGLDMNEADSNYKLKKQVVKEITIPASVKKKILSELEQLCVSQATLFPEVDKVADYLKHKI